MLRIDFYETPSGAKPVLKHLSNLKKYDRIAVGLAVGRLARDWPNTAIATKMPNTGGLCEINNAPKLINKRSYRLFFCVDGDTIILLDYIEHKQSQKTPQRILDRAISRMKAHRARRGKRP